MSIVVAWLLFGLGVAHVAFGLVKFKAPLAAAASAGFVGQFQVPEVRRTAFWFTLFGLPLMLAGHIAVHAVGVRDHALLKVIGGYVLLTSLIGVLAIPRSPFWAPLVLGPLLLAAGYGWLPR
ncbi:MAG: DUF6463 family protein [Deltaproteobacteria bacterium]|nr:DUF6463 family protein [Deltaproteobacteria bacterium]